MNEIKMTFGKNWEVNGTAWIDVNSPPVILEQVFPSGLSVVYRFEDYDESERDMIDKCLMKKHGGLITFGGKSYILRHEGRFLAISEVKRIEFDPMEVL